MKDPQNITSLFQKIHNGNEEAFTTLYKLYYNRLFRFGCVITANSGLVEDVIQNLFLRILHSPEKFQHVLNHEVYLFRSVKFNLTSNLQQKERRTAIIQNLNTAEPRATESVEEHLIKEEIRLSRIESLTSKINALPARQKEVIYLRYYEGMDYDEIAKIISVSNQVARNYASRALARMRTSTDQGDISGTGG